jgi:NAD-dependent deacetylase
VTPPATDDSEDLELAVEGTAQLAGQIARSRTITVLTGAGISTESGIPDFRGPQGLWTRNPAAESMFTYDKYVSDPEVRRQAWENRRTNATWDAEPNSGHVALVDLERSGRLVALLTQNVDELHQRAGSAPETVVELHGTLHQVECLRCGKRYPMPDILARVEQGEPDPTCERCGGMLKSATIAFGQPLDLEVLERASVAAQRCDLFLAIGSSLSVHPAAGFCDVAVRAGARLVVLNAEPTPYDESARASGGMVLRAPIGQVLPGAVRTALSQPA